MKIMRLKLIENQIARQDKFTNAFYHTPMWRSIRKQVITREPLCRECKRNGITTAAQMVDHIIPVRLGGKTYDTENLQPLCNSCHAKKSSYESKHN
jgi:5-methylcytosine-specific restriction protein A